MKMQLKVISFPELSFKLNNINPAQNNKFEIKPRFERQIKIANENPHIHIVNLICSIISTENDKKPFNLVVNISGVFEIEDEFYDEKEFAKEATKFIFPYLRSAISSLTMTANITPLHLPILPDGILFPEDREDNFMPND